jgi:trans-aconitate methyltransferase
VTELRNKWNWKGNFNGSFCQTIYDICCGPGRCVKYYAAMFEYICLHDQSQEFVDSAAFEVSRLKSQPDLNIYRHPKFKCVARLDQITFPKSRVHFIFANYAFQNLKDSQLQPTMKKCIDNLECGGIIFIKEPHPLEEKQCEFDEQMQRILRPKKAYIDILLNYGCIKVKEHTHAYRYSPIKFGREFILVFRKVSDTNVPQQ